MIRVYYTDTGSLRDPSLFDLYYKTVSEYRKAKIDRLVREEDKRSSLAAEVLLIRGLSDAGADYNPSVSPVVNSAGKPTLPSNDICYNLSHSKERTVCIISDSECGCDVESDDSADIAVAERFFSDAERQQIASSNDPDAMFIRLWTLKESFLKTAGTGLSIPLDRFSIMIQNDEITVEQSINDCDYHFKEFSIGDGYRYSCCSIADEIPDCMEFVRLR